MGAQQGGSDAIKRMQLAAAGRSRRADALGRRADQATETESPNLGLGGNTFQPQPSGFGSADYFDRDQFNKLAASTGNPSYGERINSQGFKDFLQQLADKRGGKI